MAGAEIDILSIDRGLVIAPAGCGKTQLIIDALCRNASQKPILILTHTNAGVAALRRRLEAARVPGMAYRLTTIDGFAIRLVTTFPGAAQFDLSRLEAETPPYKDIRIAACRILEMPRIHDAVLATYARLFVDEYQDCSSWQHGVIYYLSHVLPTCVLGDQLQSIFGFGGDDLADWANHVCGHFPLAAELTTPWRWINAGAQPLGNWLLAARQNLLAGKPVDIRTAPNQLTWLTLDGSNADRAKQLAAGRTKPPNEDGNVLIIGDSRSPESQRRFASQIHGATTVEAVDLRDLVRFASQLSLTSPTLLRESAGFAASVMTSIAPDDLFQRVATILGGRARKPADDVEQAAIDLTQAPSYPGISRLLAEMNRQSGVRVHRPLVLRACLRALNAASVPGGPTFREAVVHTREQYRMMGRSLPRRGVGSTLLLKGLEADVCIILDADKLNAKNLYVALTRGSRRVVVCSRSPILPP